MNSPAKAHEPTMEEILASIRRIISDDDKAPAPSGAPKSETTKAEPAPLTKPAAEPVGQDDIDALFAAADTEAAVGQDDIDALFAAVDEPVKPAKAPEPIKAPEPARSFEPLKTPEPVKPPAPPAAVQPEALENDLDILELTEEMREPEPARPARPAAPPVSEPSAPKLSMRIDDGLISAAVSDQVSNAFGSLAHTVLAGNAKTLDDIVREMLRPMLKAWLDDNLPPLVERLVRHEIERVARGGR